VNIFIVGLGHKAAIFELGQDQTQAIDQLLMLDSTDQASLRDRARPSDAALDIGAVKAAVEAKAIVVGRHIGGCRLFETSTPQFVRFTHCYIPSLCASI